MNYKNDISLSLSLAHHSGNNLIDSLLTVGWIANIDSCSRVEELVQKNKYFEYFSILLALYLLRDVYFGIQHYVTILVGSLTREMSKDLKYEKYRLRDNFILWR